MIRVSPTIPVSRRRGSTVSIRGVTHRQGFGGRVAWCAALAVVIAIASGAQVATAQESFRWSSARSLSSSSDLTDISCVSPSYCVAVGAARRDKRGVAFISSNASSRSPVWKRVGLPHALDRLTCLSARLCVGVSDSVIVTTSDPGTPSAWITQLDHPRDELHDVSCASSTLCVVSGQGGVWTTANPEGGASAWTHTALVKPASTASLRAVDCSPEGLCAVGAAQSPRVFVSRRPTDGAAAWRATRLPRASGVTTVACAGTGYCIAGTTGAQMFQATNVSSASPWRLRFQGPLAYTAYPGQATCILPGRCVVPAARFERPLEVWTSRANAWTRTTVRRFNPETTKFGGVEFGVSCPTLRFCMIVGQRGVVTVGRR